MCWRQFVTLHKKFVSHSLLVLNSQADARKCLLCGVAGDAESSGAGRLLCCGLDEWVHINCGLWSAEVFEDDEGRLQNVQVALSRGKQMVK